MTTQEKGSPDGAILEVQVLIDTDKWEELQSQGYSDIDIQRMIEKAVTFDKSKAPIHDFEYVKVVKTY